MTAPPEGIESPLATDPGAPGQEGASSVLYRAADAVLRSWPKDSPYRSPSEVQDRLQAILAAAGKGDRDHWPPEIAEELARDRSFVRRLLRTLWLEVLRDSVPPALAVRLRNT